MEIEFNLISRFSVLSVAQILKCIFLVAPDLVVTGVSFSKILP